MDAREQRGLTIAAICKLTHRDGRWAASSQSATDKKYFVDPSQSSCTCPDHKETGFKCKHQWAVEYMVRRETAVDGTVTETRTVTITEKKTYPQNWAAYNSAQVSERRHFHELLDVLCATIPEQPTKGNRKGGRPSIPIRDAIF